MLNRLERGRPEGIIEGVNWQLFCFPAIPKADDYLLRFYGHVDEDVR